MQLHIWSSLARHKMWKPLRCMLLPVMDAAVLPPRPGLFVTASRKACMSDKLLQDLWPLINKCNCDMLVTSCCFWRKRLSFPFRMQRHPCFGPAAGNDHRTRRSQGTAGRPWLATSQSPARPLCRPGSAPRHCSLSQPGLYRSLCSPYNIEHCS
jgi:hypothetical protein